MSASTQEHIPIRNIHDDLVILKDGSAAVILNTSAVNFDLLSEIEQMAIIDAFAAMLNSLSFAIQIVIRSKRLDISTYLESLNVIESKQTNPLLAGLMKSYRNFIETTTRENEVLDKQFFIVIQVSYLEIGFSGDTEKNIDKALTILLPRRDHIIRQLNRIGLTATQLNNEDLTKLFYDIYNETQIEIPDIQTPSSQQQPVPREVVQAQSVAGSQQNPVITNQSNNLPGTPFKPIQPVAETQATSPQLPATNPIPQKQIQVNPPPPQPVNQNQNMQLGPNARALHQATPFVVEELPD